MKQVDILFFEACMLIRCHSAKFTRNPHKLTFTVKLSFSNMWLQHGTFGYVLNSNNILAYHAWCEEHNARLRSI